MNAVSSSDARPAALFRALPRLANLALVLIGLALVGFTRQLISENDHFTIGHSGVSSWQVVLYLAAVFLIFLRKTDRFTFPILLAVAIACRLVALFPEPSLSTDVYRYVWDGIVQHAHINPYRYVPADPHLAFLREAGDGNVYDPINRKTYAHTIYPPAAQMLFYLVTWISPTVTCMKTAMVLFEGLLLWATVRILRRLGIPREQAVLYMWCPLPIWEFAGSGHLDASAMAFIALAVLARLRNRPVLTGAFLGIAILIKFYPAVLVPALYNRFGRDGKMEWKMPATILALAAACYAVYASAGPLVFGFLSGYVQEEGIETGSRYFLLQLAQHLPGLHGLPNAAFLVFCGLIFLGLMLWSWRMASQPALATGTVRERAPFLAPAFALASALMLLFSPHYPWYIAWLIPFLALLPNLPILAYVCGLFYWCTTAIAVGYGPKQYLLNEYLYSWIAVAVIMQLAVHRWPVHRHLFPQPRPQ